MATGALDILWAMLCCSRICHGVSACLLLLKTGMLLDYYDSKRCFESPYAPGNGAQRLGSIRRNRNWLLTLLLGSHFFSQLRLSPKQFVWFLSISHNTISAVYKMSRIRTPRHLLWSFAKIQIFLVF